MYAVGCGSAIIPALAAPRASVRQLKQKEVARLLLCQFCLLLVAQERERERDKERGVREKGHAVQDEQEKHCRRSHPVGWQRMCGRCPPSVSVILLSLSLSLSLPLSDLSLSLSLSLVARKFAKLWHRAACCIARPIYKVKIIIGAKADGDRGGQMRERVMSVGRGVSQQRPES